jgi:hypothetical protein
MRNKKKRHPNITEYGSDGRKEIFEIFTLEEWLRGKHSRNKVSTDKK